MRDPGNEVRVYHLGMMSLDILKLALTFTWSSLVGTPDNRNRVYSLTSVFIMLKNRMARTECFEISLKRPEIAHAA